MEIAPLTPDEWPKLRDLRLSALLDSPGSFLHTYEDEREFGPAEWMAEFERGSWHSTKVNGELITLLGVTREYRAPTYEYYLEYLWVSPSSRRAGLARQLLTKVLKGLRRSGVRTVFLWVLDGNHVAVQVYERLGFISTGRRQPLPDRPSRWEEQMVLDLRLWRLRRIRVQARRYIRRQWNSLRSSR